MAKLIRGEIYRLLHKKSMYIYFGALILGYCLLVFMRSGGFDSESVMMDAPSFFQFFPALIGGFLFAAVYTDDLNSKNLITLVGYGLGKSTIALAKFIIGVLSATVIFGLITAIHCGIYTLLGHAPTAQQAEMVFITSLTQLMMTVAFFAFSSIVAFGLQRTTFAFVVYILFGFSVVTMLVKTVFSLAHIEISQYLVSGITNTLMARMVNGASVVAPVLEYAAYIIVAIALSVLAFRKKEMEF